MKQYISILTAFSIFMIVGCQGNNLVTTELPVLKDVYKNSFMIGTALNGRQISGHDAKTLNLALQQFNTFTAENVLKWERVHPEFEEYKFDLPDRFVELGIKNNIFLVGHTLLWHNQTPDWVFEDAEGNPVTRDVLLQRLKDHIFTVVGRYKGKIKGWDVVNEAFEDDGSMRKTKWSTIIGEDYIEKAFQFAHEADPEAELYYNDFNMWKGKKQAVVNLVENFQVKGIPIHGIGMQGHWGLDYPPMDELETALQTYAATGLKIMITELDIRVLPNPDSDTGADITKDFALQAKLNPYPDALPDSMQTVLADRYAGFFKLLLKYKNSVSRVTFWGVHDGMSWCNHWPVRGRTDYPLIFDRNLQPKPAFYKIISLIE